LAVEIALNKDRRQLGERLIQQAENISRIPVPGLLVPNEAQTEAIKKAMTQMFTLIQGPPGTGKTVTGVRLAYLFAQLNKARQGTNPQILICGPSNDSVDVFAKHLSQLDGMSSSIVRVYSAMIELQDYPLPLDRLSGQERTYVRESAMNMYALHHMIRHPAESSYSRGIRRIDAKIQELRRNDPIKDLSEEEKKEYKGLIHEAKMEVVKKRQIILCTCHVAASKVIMTGCNVKQLIIDECGMCTEPQSMVPIISSNPEQVVLLGDHKQLQPIILEQLAKRLGLGKSLFERYADDALMLTHQYRMQEAIAEFPSKKFYGGRLKSGLAALSEQSSLPNFWPGGVTTPIMFVHVVGLEESLSVATAEGSEQSRSNMEEVKEVVRVVTYLLNNHAIKSRPKPIKPEDILVLSQYRAQCAKIQKELERVKRTKSSGRYMEVNCRDVKVSTVVAAQGGERDYIVWSTVRSLPKSKLEKRPSTGWSRRNLGFITDEHQVNVALTRAKKGLIIIGNKNLLECHPLWENLLHHYKEKKAIIDGRHLSTSHEYIV